MNMPSLALPPGLTTSARISWHVSSWCNYSCDYCGVLVYRKRASDGTKQAHAFDYYPVEQWIEAFRNLPLEHMLIKITGGEPMLDRANVRALLQGLTADKRFLIRIDTNGTWDPAYFSDIDKSRIALNMSFHPQEITLQEFLPRARKIRAAGFPIGKINFVLAPENLDSSERAIEALEEEGFFVNVAAMMSSGVYASREERTRRELDILEKYNTPIDMHYRLVNPPTKDRLCYHPAISYYMLCNGQVTVQCLNEWQNLFTDGLPDRPREAVPCPLQKCEGCIEMFRALADEPRVTRPLSLFTLDEYRDEVQDYRKSFRWKSKLRRLPVVGKLAGEPFQMPERPATDLLIPADGIKAALPDQAVVGQVESFNGPAIDARSRDRLAFQGWAFSPPTTSPVKEVRLLLNDDSLGIIQDFHERPDIAHRFARAELVKCGWKAMFYLPALSRGEYRLSIVGVTSTGVVSEFGQSTLRVID